MDKSKRNDPVIKFLTKHTWSDEKLLAVDGDTLYYLTTGVNYTHRHLYRYAIITRWVKVSLLDITVT